MNERVSVAFAVIAACAMSGCGGGTGQVPLSELITEFDTLLNDGNGPLSPNAPLLTRQQAAAVGSASYDGVATVLIQGAGSTVENPVLDFLAMGDATATVDFADGELRGTADNFYEVDTAVAGLRENTPGVPIAGSLSFQLTDVAPQQSTILYSGTMRVDLEPDNAQAITLRNTATAYFTGAGADGLGIDGSNPSRDIEVIVAAGKN